MKVKHFLEDIARVPGDYELCLSKVMTVNMDKAEEAEKAGVKDVDDDTFTVAEDIPIVGLAINDEGKEVRLVVKDSDAQSIRNLHKNAKSYVEHILKEKITGEPREDRAIGEGPQGSAFEAP